MEEEESVINPPVLVEGYVEEGDTPDYGVAIPFESPPSLTPVIIIARPAPESASVGVAVPVTGDEGAGGTTLPNEGPSTEDCGVSGHCKSNNSAQGSEDDQSLRTLLPAQVNLGVDADYISKEVLSLAEKGMLLLGMSQDCPDALKGEELKRDSELALRMAQQIKEVALETGLAKVRTDHLSSDV